MTNNVVLLFGGMIAGLLTAIPIGPTNFWILRAALPPPRPRRNVLAFVGTLLCFDAIFAALAYWGYSAWFARSTYADGTMFISGFGLALLGLHGLWKCRRHDETTETSSEAAFRPAGSRSSLFADLSFGCLIGSNPAFIAYWIVVVSTAAAYLGSELTPINMAAVFVGIVGGDILWYAILWRFAKRYSRDVSPFFALCIRVGISSAFVVCGGIFVFRSFQ